MTIYKLYLEFREEWIYEKLINVQISSIYIYITRLGNSLIIIKEK